MAENSSNKRIAKNTIFLSIRMVVVTFISIFTTRFLLENLGVEDFGVYNVTLGIVTMCAFIRPSLSNAIQRYYNYELGKENPKGASCVFSTGIVIQVILALTIIFVCETIGLWYVYNKLVVPDGRFEAVLVIFHISVCSVAASMLQVPYTAAVMAHEKLDFYAVLNIIDVVLKLLIAVLIKYAPFDRLVFYGSLLAMVTLLNLIVNYLYVKKNFSEARFSIDGVKEKFKPLLSFSVWNLFESIARIGKQQGGNMLLNFFFGPVVNAARGIAAQIDYAYSSFVESASTAVRPQMIQRYARGEEAAAVSMFYTLSKFTIIIVLMLAYPIFLDIDYVLHLWLGAKVPEIAALFVRITLLWLVVDKLASPTTAIIHATGKIKKYHVFSGLLNIVTIPIVWILFKMGLDSYYIYIVFFLVAIVALLIFLFVLKSLVAISISSYLVEVMVKPIISFSVISLIPYLLYTYMNTGIIRLFVLLVVNVVCYSAALYVLALKPSEKKLIKSFISKRKK